MDADEIISLIGSDISRSQVDQLLGQGIQPDEIVNAFFDARLDVLLDQLHSDSGDEDGTKTKVAKQGNRIDSTGMPTHISSSKRVDASSKPAYDVNLASDSSDSDDDEDSLALRLLKKSDRNKAVLKHLSNDIIQLEDQSSSSLPTSTPKIARLASKAEDEIEIIAIDDSDINAVSSRRGEGQSRSNHDRSDNDDDNDIVLHASGDTEPEDYPSTANNTPAIKLDLSFQQLKQRTSERGKRKKQQLTTNADSDSDDDDELPSINLGLVSEQNSSQTVSTAHLYAQSHLETNGVRNDPQPAIDDNDRDTKLACDGSQSTKKPVQPKPKRSRLTDAEREQRRQAKDAERARKQQAKEQRAREKAAQKQALEHSKQTAKLERQLSKARKPGERLSQMEMRAGADVLQTQRYSPLQQQMTSAGVTVVSVDKPMFDMCLTFRRKVPQLDRGTNELSYTYTPEQHAIILLSAAEFVPKAADTTIRNYAKRLKDTFTSDWKLTLIIEGLESHFRSQTNRANRAWRQAVQEGKTSGQAPPPDTTSADRMAVEHVLVWLQMEAGFFLRLSKNSLETMEMVYMYTKAIATAPDKTISTNFTFCPHVDRCVKVDSKTFAGLRELWKKQLTCFSGVSADKAEAIVQHYPSPRALLKGFNDRGMDAVATLVPLGHKHALGPKIAQRIHNFLTTDDPNAMTT